MRFWYALGSRRHLLAVNAPMLLAWTWDAAAVYAQAPAGVKAFVDVNVIPMDSERVLTNQTVVVEGGWIRALGPSAQVKVPARAVQIDGRGRYLIPGLADMHVHLFSANDTSMARAERDLLSYVAYGVTTIRNMDHNVGGYYYYSKGPAAPLEPTLRLRARAAAGELISPRIYTSGQWGPPNYTNSNKHYTRKGAKHASAVSLDSIAVYVAAYQAAGYDFVKPYYEADLVFDSLVAVTRRLGIPMAGHIPESDRSITLERVLASNAYRSVEHLMRYSDPTNLDTAKMQALVAATQRAGIWNTPTLAAYYNSSASSTPAILDLRRRIIKALQDAGAGLLLGVDASSNLMFLFMPRPGLGVHQELQALVGAGLTPYQALATGTKNVAQYFGTLDSTGTVAVGKRADLVLLRENPLADIQHTLGLAGVMLRGRWLEQEALASGRRTP